jgi:hypothetical protein
MASISNIKSCPFERNKGVGYDSFYFGCTPTIFVIFVLNVATIERLVELHNKHIEGQDFAVNFKVCKRDLLFFILVCKFLYEIPNLVVPIFF